MNERKKMLEIIKAPLTKRYKNFINTVVDSEQVWLLDGGNGYCSYDDGNEISIIVYPTEEFANYFSKGATPVMMEVHEFCRECNKLDKEKNILFAVFPNDENAMQVSPQALYYDLVEALEEVEDFNENV